VEEKKGLSVWVVPRGGWEGEGGGKISNKGLLNGGEKGELVPSHRRRSGGIIFSGRRTHGEDSSCHLYLWGEEIGQATSIPSCKKERK